jgi:hypothetical protein
LAASASARSSARRRDSEKRKNWKVKNLLLEGKKSFGGNRNYSKKNVALPLRVAASSRNPMNWEPRLMRCFIKVCKNYESGSTSKEAKFDGKRKTDK